MILAVSELMPEGKPDLLGVRRFKPIRELIQDVGKKQMLAMLVIIVKDFCSSLNVVRNMNEDQIIEAAAMLLDECENFRLEDYVVMFAMAKRGSLVKIYDRVDLQVISEIMDAYWLIRIRKIREELDREVMEIENGTWDRQTPVFDEKKKTYVVEKSVSGKLMDIAGVLGDMKQKLIKKSKVENHGQD